MPIDAAVESVLSVVETHQVLLLAWVRGLDPAAWLEGAPFLKIPRQGQGSTLSPYILGTDPGPSQSEDMMSIQALQRTPGRDGFS